MVQWPGGGRPDAEPPQPQAAAHAAATPTKAVTRIAESKVDMGGTVSFVAHTPGNVQQAPKAPVLSLRAGRKRGYCVERLHARDGLQPFRGEADPVQNAALRGTPDLRF